ncbi:MAG: amidohydrolase family protein [Halobacteriaceae archaeon]
MLLEGTVLTGSAFDPVEGRVVIEDGVITAVEEASVDTDDWILPAFVNAHTHIGDAIAKEAGAGLSLEELVAPPDGLKHRLLAEASREELVEAMARTVAFMEQAGTSHFLEFREGGVEGVEALREAVGASPVEPVVFGRGSESVLEVADGFGASSTDDGDFAGVRRAAREAEKLFAIHAGEVDDGDINPAIDLDPDLLVHMVHAGDLHLDRVADREIPVAVCPRSNLTTGVGLPPVEDLVDRTTVALGTDNVFLNAPSMFREMEFAEKLFDLSATDVLAMATRAGAEAVGVGGGVIEAGEPARLLVLDGGSDNLAGARDPVRALVRRAGVADVERVYLPST